MGSNKQMHILCLELAIEKVCKPNKNSLQENTSPFANTNQSCATCVALWRSSFTAGFQECHQQQGFMIF